MFKLHIVRDEVKGIGGMCIESCAVEKRRIELNLERSSRDIRHKQCNRNKEGKSTHCTVILCTILHYNVIVDIATTLSSSDDSE